MTKDANGEFIHSWHSIFKKIYFLIWYWDKNVLLAKVLRKHIVLLVGISYVGHHMRCKSSIAVFWQRTYIKLCRFCEFFLSLSDTICVFLFFVKSCKKMYKHYINWRERDWTTCRLSVLYSLESWHSCLSFDWIRPIVKYSGDRTWWSSWRRLRNLSRRKTWPRRFCLRIVTRIVLHVPQWRCAPSSHHHRSWSPFSSFFFIVAVSSLCRGHETENAWTLSQNKLASTYTTGYQNIIRERVVCHR